MIGSRKSTDPIPVAALLFAALPLLAVLLKVTSYGDLNRSADEMFYFLVGQRMHEGLVPYADIWDRKPFGLFLIYYLIAGLSDSVISYQLVASLFTGATAAIIGLIVNRWSGPRGGILAGITYVFAIGFFEGNTGQAADFYNFFLALAGLLLLVERDNLAKGIVSSRTLLAMASCGVAITIKHSALFESIFFGLWAVFSLRRSGASPGRTLARAALFCLIGAAPTLAIAGWYWLAGYWGEFWQAMVLSNLAKAGHEGAGWRLVLIAVRALVIVPVALLGLSQRGLDSQTRWFVGGWLTAALIGVLAMQNFYLHYAMSLIAPLSIAAGLFFARHQFWKIGLALFAASCVLWTRFDYTEWRAGSNASMNDIARLIEDHDDGGDLLVFDAPPYLYQLTGHAFLSPLVFPHHLNHAIEKDVSHLETNAEIDRILSAKPSVIVFSIVPRNQPPNTYAWRKVMDYASANCSFRKIVNLNETVTLVGTAIYGDCRTNGDKVE